jgi:hypothetical protein
MCARYFRLWLLASLLFFARLSLADPDGLEGKLIVGYQGWFGCPGDFEGNTRWQHWFEGPASDGRFVVDQVPSLRGLRDEDLCETPLRRADGSALRLFSSQNANVVAAHFRWMRDQAIDGAAVQRFVSELADPVARRRSDHVLRNARAASEDSGRLIFVSYDVSGANPANVIDDIRRDWRYVATDLQLTQSRSYLRQGGRPVVMLWGFGFTDRPGSPEQVAALIADLQHGEHGLQAATVIGGVPSYWRTLTRDSKSDPAWASVYRAYDVLSPWSVGRFADDAGADAFLRDVVVPDIEEARRSNIGYLPVAFPGFSWSNLMAARGRKDGAAINVIPRRCGAFLWGQLAGLLRLRVHSLYVAMFDELDEATAIMPTEMRAERLPRGHDMVHPGMDQCSASDDAYLEMLGLAGRYLRAGSIPPRNRVYFLP